MADALVVQSVRSDAIPRLCAQLQQHFHELVDSDQRVNMVYETSPKHIDGVDLAEHLQRNRHKEIAAGVTLYGPHREDILFTWGEHLATEGMSRGQVRALVLAFKLAEVEYIEGKTGLAPILLLDDVFSEFDDVRKGRVIELSKTYQTVLTTTELDDVHKTDSTYVISL